MHGVMNWAAIDVISVKCKASHHICMITAQVRGTCEEFTCDCVKASVLTAEFETGQAGKWMSSHGKGGKIMRVARGGAGGGG